jgi:hypothetical protein
MPCLAHQRAARCGTISVAERGYAVHDAPTGAVSWERHHGNSFAPKGISRNLADPEWRSRPNASGCGLTLRNTDKDARIFVNAATLIRVGRVNHTSASRSSHASSLPSLTIATSIVVLSGCHYHAVIDTGAAAAGEAARDGVRVHLFIYGLIPPAVPRPPCPGVAESGNAVSVSTGWPSSDHVRPLATDDDHLSAVPRAARRRRTRSRLTSERLARRQPWSRPSSFLASLERAGVIIHF